MLLENKIIGNKDKKIDNEQVFNTPAALDLSWRPFYVGGAAKDLIINRCTIYGNGYGEGLKLSFPNNALIMNTNIYGGYEDVVDIVRGVQVTFERCNFFTTKKTRNFFTIKGGAKKINIKNCKFVGTPKDLFAFKLGDWTDYDHIDRPKVRDIRIENCSFEMYKKRFLFLTIYSNKPKVINCKGKYIGGIVVPALLQRLYWRYKRASSFIPVDERELKVYPIEN